MVEDQVTASYIDECVNGNGSLWGKSASDLLPSTYAQSYGSLTLARPLFVHYDEVNRFATDLAELFGVLTSLPERCFDGSLERYCAALAMDERLSQLMRFGATGRPPLYARADAYHDGTSFRLLELNVGSELGGIDSAQVNRAFLRINSFREFADRWGLGYVDTTERLAAALREPGRSVTSGEPVVALIEGRSALAEHEHVFVAIREAMRQHGVELLLGEVDQLGTRNGKLTLDGVPLDVVLRYFTAGQLLDDPAGPAELEMVMGAHAAAKTVLFTPLEGALFASKGSLGLLHEPSVRRLLTPRELDVVDRTVPWTRVVGASSGPASDWEELLDHCRANRDSLVLKPGVGYGAVGVVLGREATDDAWRDALLAARDRDHVVQQVVVPAPEPVLNPETGEREDWHANWGIFVTDGGYGGAFVRALRPGDGSVISYSNPGTRGGCVFTWAGPDQPAPSVTSGRTD